MLLHLMAKVVGWKVGKVEEIQMIETMATTMVVTVMSQLIEVMHWHRYRDGNGYCDDVGLRVARDDDLPIATSSGANSAAG